MPHRSQARRPTGAGGAAVLPLLMLGLLLDACGRPDPERAALGGPEVGDSGRHLLAVRNVGAQDHQLRLARLRPGATVRDWMDADDPGEVVTDVAGVARLGAGQSAYLPVDLAAGEYVASGSTGAADGSGSGPRAAYRRHHRPAFSRASRSARRRRAVAA